MINNINSHSIINNFLIYDIFEEISKYLDPFSINNLLNSNKSFMDFYLKNSKQINKILIIKIFDYFNLWKKKNDPMYKHKFFHYLDIYEISYLKNHCFKLYTHFYNHPTSNIGDLLIYLIESVDKFEPNCLFKHLISLCDKKIYFDQKINRNKVTTNDIIYILTYSNYYHFTILLNHFYIKPSLMSYIIKDIIKERRKNNSLDYKEKVYKSIDYYFYEYSINTTNQHISNKVFNLFLNQILTNLVEHKEMEFIDYILSKKRKYDACKFKKTKIDLNYQTLICECIESNNLNALTTFWIEYRNDSHNNTNENENENVFDTDIIIIKPEIIMNVCKNGWFKMLQFIVQNFLYNTINLNGYINAICDGLFVYCYTDYNEKCKNLNQLEFLNNFLTQNNKETLNHQINLIYTTNRTLNKIVTIKFGDNLNTN